MDIKAVTKATGKIATALWRFFVPGVRRLVLSLLILFEAAFAIRSVIDLYSGGVNAMIGRWGELVYPDWPFVPLSSPFPWGKFLFRHFVILLVLATLWFLDRRYRQEQRVHGQASK